MFGFFEKKKKKPMPPELRKMYLNAAMAQQSPAPYTPTQAELNAEEEFNRIQQSVKYNHSGGYRRKTRRSKARKSCSTNKSRR